MSRDYIIAALKQDLRELASSELAPVEVAILDSGIDASHPDLAGKVIKSFAVEMVDGKPQSRETTLGENNDAYGHGTGVASIISRIAPNARLVDIRVLGSDNRGSGTALVEGLKIAVKIDARVVNMSLAASQKFSPNILPLCEKAYHKNQVLVASKKNMPLTDLGFPAEFSNCISVDSEGFDDSHTFKYLPDQVIEFAALGEEVPCAAPGGGYTTSTGTSFATPAIAGVCALCIGKFTDLRPFEVKTILKAWALEAD